MQAAAVSDERAALEDCVGALQFILAFYEPGQRVLDTEAWKSACAKGVAAYHRGTSVIGWGAFPYRAVNGEVHRDYTEQAPALSDMKVEVGK